MRFTTRESHADGRVIENSTDPLEEGHYELPRGTSPTSTPDDVDPQAQFLKFREFRQKVWDSKQPATQPKPTTETGSRTGHPQREAQKLIRRKKGK